MPSVPPAASAPVDKALNSYSDAVRAERPAPWSLPWQATSRKLRQTQHMPHRRHGYAAASNDEILTHPKSARERPPLVANFAHEHE